MNNVVVFERGVVSTDVNIGAGVDEGSFSWENNSFYATDTPGQSAPVLPGTETGTIAATDPMLQADGSPQVGSPVAGAGIDGVDTVGDFVGACWASPPSVGAFEAQ